MKKGVQFSVWIFGIGTVFVAACLGTAHVLKLYHLMFRAWVEMTFFTIVVLFGAALAGSILYALGKMFSLPQEQPKKRIAQKVLSALGIVFTLFSIGILGIGVFFGVGFGSASEEVVEKYGQKMVAYEEHWLDTRVTYHEYKNFLVCGYPVLGYEIYGAGFYTYEFYDTQGNLIVRSQNHQSTSQNDEGEQSESRSEAKPQVKILDIIVEENQKNELVFSVSIEDFIASFNSLYLQDHSNPYLKAPTQWTVFNDASPYYNYDAYHYQFTEDEKIGSMPTISVYSTADESFIYEIKLTFDDHGYREEFYKIYEEMCLYSLKIFLPDFSGNELSQLYSDLYSLTDTNFYGDIYRRPPSDLYYKGGIGFYGYYGAGTANICVIPVNESILETLSQEGAVLHDLENGLQSQP